MKNSEINLENLVREKLEISKDVDFDLKRTLSNFLGESTHVITRQLITEPANATRELVNKLSGFLGIARMTLIEAGFGKNAITISEAEEMQLQDDQELLTPAENQ